MKTTKKKLAVMSWILLEYQVVYYAYEHGITIHDDWLNLRDISNDEYDRKEKKYISLCKRFGIKNKVTVGLDSNRPSTKMVIEKLSKQMSDSSYPSVWPDETTVSDSELTFHLMLEFMNSSYIGKLVIRKFS